MAGKLTLIGIGISDEKGISLLGLEKLKECKRAFAETYTNLIPEGTYSRLEALCGKKIEVLARTDVEGERQLLDSALHEPTALVVPGDPMIATTHSSLVLSAKKKGIETEIIHASSIMPVAAGESGLQAYKFGKTVTLAYWRENYKPMAAYETIAENLSRGLHTLLLLDIDEKMGPMPPHVAAETIAKMEKEAGKGVLTPTRKIILLQGIGWHSPVRKYLALSQLAKEKEGKGPALLIIPAQLHFLEEEYLSSL